MKITLQHNETLPTLVSPNEPTERKTTARLTLDKRDEAWVTAPHALGGELSINIEHNKEGVKIFIYGGGRGQLRIKSYDFEHHDTFDEFTEDANAMFTVMRVDEER